MVTMESEAKRVFRTVILADLVQIRQFVRETAVSGGCDPALLDELVVAANEAIANIIQHGYRDNPGDITVKIRCHNDTVLVTLCDTCASFDPTTVSQPDMTLPLAERPFGGMGVHMMREFCDELIYRRTENNENELTLAKRKKQ